MDISSDRFKTLSSRYAKEFSYIDQANKNIEYYKAQKDAAVDE
jgi:hypothetical protein